jgi:hypothetical protein
LLESLDFGQAERYIALCNGPLVHEIIPERIVEPADKLGETMALDNAKVLQVSESEYPPNHRQL